MTSMRLLVAGQVLVALLVAWRYAPPAPVGVDAPPGEFSAARAAAVLGDLLGDGAPHPCGSAANRAVRDRLVAQLEGLGYAPPKAMCEPRGGCCDVENVSAVVPGVQSDSYVALVAHYDSVSEGPGAGDDGAGVAAILEIARALTTRPKPQRSILLLFTDGEEKGLLGARAFAERDPRAGQLAAVLNLEARGTSGPSIMFETTPGNAALVSAFAGAASRPVTNSLAVAVYRAMPNDTDLTVFREAGLGGLNFAFLGSGQNYHTPQDSLENLDLGSLQHHGDNAFGALLALAAGAPVEADGDSVFFDVLAAWVVRWPAPWTLPMALAAMVLILVSWWRRRRRGLVGGWGPVKGAGWALGGVAFAGLLAFGVLALLRATGLVTERWQAEPRPLLGLFFGLGVFAAWLSGRMASRRLRSEEVWLGVWGLWGLLGIAVAGWQPGVAYLFVAPTLVAGVMSLSMGGRASSEAALHAVPAALAASLVCFPLLPLLYDALSAYALWAITGLLAFALTPSLPALSWRAEPPREPLDGGDSLT